MRDSIIARCGEIFLEQEKFFTIRAKVPNLGCADFVLCRKESHYEDGRHPSQVSIGSLYDDMSRRDATVNALAQDEEGNIIDYFGGLNDLNNRILRAVGDPMERFREDRLRILRFLRFSITKDFRIEPNTWWSMQAFTDLQGVSDERVREELHKMFKFNTIKSIELLSKFPDILNYVFSSNLWLEPSLKIR